MTLPSRTGWTVLAGLALLVPLGLTLRPAEVQSGALTATHWWCLACGPSGGADLFQNLLLLLPLGFCLARARWRPARAILLVALVPIGIELAQGFVIPGRDASLGDVLANAAGGMLGFWLGSGLGYRSSGASVGHRLAALAHGLFIAQLLATASLVRPRVDGPRPWHLSLTPTVPGRPTYRGNVLHTARDGQAMLIGSGADANPIRSDSVHWRWVLTWDPPDDKALTPIWRLDDSRAWAIATLDRRGNNIAASSRVVASLLRLRDLTFSVPVPDDLAAGDTIVVDYTANRGSVSLALTPPGSEHTLQTVRLGAQHGWTLINPFTPVHHSQTTWRLWTLAWLFGWGLLLGATMRSWRGGWPWLMTALIALWAATLWSGTAATLPQFAALALGAAPWALRRGAARRGARRWRAERLDPSS